MTKDDSVLHQHVSKRPTRSWLFTPATRPERFAKAKQAGADVQIIDLEDSVPLAENESARRNAFDYLAKLMANGPLEALRVNAMRTRWGLGDLETLMQHEVEPEFVIIPKVESPADIALVAELLGGGGKSAAIVAMIESARAVARVEQIVESGPRLSYLLFGSADLAADLKGAGTVDGQMVDAAVARHARQVVALAQALGIQF